MTLICLTAQWEGKYGESGTPVRKKDARRSRQRTFRRPTVSMSANVIEEVFKAPSDSQSRDHQHWAQVGDLRAPVLPAGVVTTIQLGVGFTDHASTALGLP